MAEAPILGVGQLSSAWFSSEWHWEQAEAWCPGVRTTTPAVASPRACIYIRDAMRARLYLRDIDDERQILDGIPSIFH